MGDLTHESFSAGNLESIRQTLIDIYAEVYADRIEEPFFTLADFAGRLSGYAASPGFQCIVGFDDREAVGYAFGYTLPTTAGWWRGLTDPVDPSLLVETGHRTFALNELMVRSRWRGTGAAKQIHDRLLILRSEERVTLLVESTHPRVRATYESWGYEFLSHIRPALPNAPLLDAMLMPIHATLQPPVAPPG